MINPEQIKAFFPPYVSANPALTKYILKEYLQMLMLDYLVSSEFMNRLVFIGGTNLRLAKGIDRFSEDLDFDCKGLSEHDFDRMTDGVTQFLLRNGYHVENRDQTWPKLCAFRRNMYFPGLLYELGLSPHREERFLIKIEAEDQGMDYSPTMTYVKSCGMFFAIPSPSDPVLCSMKISALISRQKGRDFYDTMFLLAQTQPDYSFLGARHGIHNAKELKEALLAICDKTDLRRKARDFEHLCFRQQNNKRILQFREFVLTLSRDG